MINVSILIKSRETCPCYLNIFIFHELILKIIHHAYPYLFVIYIELKSWQVIA